MNDDVFAMELTLAGIIAAGTALWGWLGWLVLLWVFCMATDYITGTLAALKAHEWSSDAARDGLWHKGGMFFVALVAALTDLVVSLLLQAGVLDLPFDRSVLLTTLVLSWYTMTELGSILENAARLTDRVPPWLSKFLKIAADAAEKAGEKVVGDEAKSDDEDGFD